MGNIEDAHHSMPHVEDVLENTLQILKFLPYDEVINIEAVYWHDVGRILEEKNHAKISANMLKEELKNQGYDEEFINTCYNAIAFHSVGNEITPFTIEGKIIRDADKIAFVGIGRWKEAILKNIKISVIFDTILK